MIALMARAGKPQKLTQDPQNANKGTTKGKAMLAESLTRLGAGRSIVADKNGVVIAGNKTLQAAEAQGIPVRIVETDGKELVVVQRTDLDLANGDTRARERMSDMGLEPTLAAG